MISPETQPGGGRPWKWPVLAVVAGCALGAWWSAATARAADSSEPFDVPSVMTDHKEPAILRPPPDALSVEELSTRLKVLEAEHAALLKRLDGGIDDGDAGRAIRQTRFQQTQATPNLDRRSGSLSGVGASNTDLRPTTDVEYGVGYDAGFYLRPKDPVRAPYEMVVNGRMQFRYVGFAREREFWVNSAGDVIPISNANYFEIERGRLSFSGFMLDEKLEYFINLDFDTDDADRVIMHDFWVNYEFSRAFDVYLGKSFVPGSRDWLNGALTTRFADRSLATSFFRPDRTNGIWVQGEPFDRRYYRMMLGDGFNTFGLQPVPEQIDDNFVYAVSLWADLGEGTYGRGYSDLKWHERLVAEVGTSFTFARDEGPGPTGEPRIEQNFIRLADGTNINTPGALAPGVVVNNFDIALWAVDAAWKWRGFSANGEYYFRQLSNISGTGPLPIRLIYNHGYYLEGGYMLIPDRFEVNARTSQIYGAYGPSREYAGGVNWFPKGSHNWKWTFDCSQIYQSAAQNSGPNYIAGETGVLFRLQLQAAF
jgi:hypothetical protein